MKWRERSYEERDRRYSEVAAEREKALKIKEEADKVALTLAREIQTYKDEKANELRSQIERERGSYATQSDLRALGDRLEAKLEPVDSQVGEIRRDMSAQRGRSAAFAAVGAVMLVMIPLVIQYLSKGGL